MRYGVPREIVTNQGTQFTSKLMKDITDKYQIKHRKSTPYYPQANGQVESTNKTLEGIITKTVAMNRKNWEEKLKEALWAYQITWKDTTGFTPYQLVYGKDVMLPIEFQIHTFKLDADLLIDLDQAQNERIQQLNQLDEMRQQAEQTTILMQKHRKQWHDSHIKKKHFKEGDWALLFDSKFKDHKAKFTTHWMGPYEIVQAYDNGSVKLQTIDGEGHSFTVNGHRLKLYNKPISKQDFLHTLSQQEEVEILQPSAAVSLP